MHEAGINVESHNRPRRDDTTCLATTHEAEGHVRPTEPHDEACRVYAFGEGSLISTRARTNVVMSPLAARTKPWYTLLASK